MTRTQAEFLGWLTLSQHHMAIPSRSQCYWKIVGRDWKGHGWGVVNPHRWWLKSTVSRMDGQLLWYAGANLIANSVQFAGSFHAMAVR